MSWSSKADWPPYVAGARIRCRGGHASGERKSMGSVELRQLEYFVAVAEHLHFGRAAAALSIGQPAVSQQVARLERMIGTPLLDRTPRSVRLPDAGRRFLPLAREALAAVDRACEAVADPSGRCCSTAGSRGASGRGGRAGR